MSETPDPPQSDLEGLDPAELMARGLDTVRPTGDGRWQPLGVEEVARLLPQYEVRKLLGRGGMGAVYQGTQISLARPVAIKLLPVEMTADKSFVARFHREARTLARLHHANIVAVYDSGMTADGHLYFVMEYVDGTDLRQVLRTQKLEPAQVLAIVSAICDALAAAHRQGVMHRDIKPENVLLTTEGEVKLADFGLARPVYEDEDLLTGTNVAVGTPAYMAPEQHAGQSDHRTDIFALGVMFYEMLCGRPPRGVIAPPSQRMQVDVRIDQVVLRALQAEPELRYQSAVEMKSDVEEIRSSGAVPQPAARRPAAPEKPGEPGLAPANPPPSRQKRIWKVVFIAICTLVVGELLSIYVRSHSLAWRSDRHDSDIMTGTLATATPGEASAASTKPSPLAALQAATKEHPYVNSLGMTFVPVPGTKTLFCTIPTRVQDFRPFAIEYGSQSLFHEPPRTTDNGFVNGGSWENPNYEQQEDFPVVNVSWNDAKAWCAWLSAREKLRYRLPTDHEWSTAVGLGHLEDPKASPMEKSEVIKRQEWGDGPPPPRFGNVSDQTMQATYPLTAGMSHTDGYANASPVTAFRPSALGLYDMSGNVNQWCEDWADSKQKAKVRRGNTWVMRLWPASHRDHWPAMKGAINCGFRCVIDLDPDGASSSQRAAP